MEVKAHVIRRPALGRYSPDVMGLETRNLPVLGPGDVRVRLIYLSLDPTNRNWLKLEDTSTVVEKVGRNLRVGDVMLGQILGVVEESASPDFNVGDHVAALAEWQEQVVLPASRLRRLEVSAGLPLTAHLTLLSHVGLAAIVGLKEIAQIRSGQTVVISGAAGATGSLAVGIAKDAGCRVVGIAGGAEKCARVLDEFGADASIDYKNGDLDAALGRTCPDGVDAYFDNVGGWILDTVLRHLVPGGRVAVCGVMADYDNATPDGIRNMYLVLVKHLRIEGFLAGGYPEKRDQHFAELREMFAAGRLKPRAHIVEDFDKAPEHLGLLFSGQNKGKLLVQVSPE